MLHHKDHLELATNLSIETAFLNYLRRFIARRGICRMIVSDNGTNFIGARNELNELGVLLKDKEYSTKMSNELGKYNIEWRLNPAHAPHFGGLWESAVNATKYYLRRIISEQKMTFDELYTLQIESCLNSRPITSLSSDPTT